MAQRTPAFVGGEFPTPAQWNSYFVNKTDTPDIQTPSSTISSLDLITIYQAATQTTKSITVSQLIVSPTSEFVYTQSTPSVLWVIVHNLGKHPSVQVVDVSGNLVEGSIQYIDTNTVNVSFSIPFSGLAYLS